MIKVIYSILMFGLLSGTSLAINNASAEDRVDTTITLIHRQVQSENTRYLPHSMHHLNEFSLLGGYSFDSFKLWGKTTDTQTSSLGIKYKRKLLNYHSLILKYVFLINTFSKYSYPEYKVGNPRNSISGFGFTPLGFQCNFRKTKTIQPFLNTSGGFMILHDPFPDVRGKKFNFTFHAGGGVEFFFLKSLSLSLGLQYRHLSNGNRGLINPGVDSSFFYTSITIL